MAKALDACCDGNLTFLSTADIGRNYADSRSVDIWPGKKLYLVPRGKRFFLRELQAIKNIVQMVLQMHKAYPGEKITVIIENSPFAAAVACAHLKKNTDVSCYSITIDTPFTRTWRKVGIRGCINSWMFTQGRKALQYFDGLISFTEDVKKDLQVDIPFCSFAIGCQSDAIPHQLPMITDEKTAVYAGTLIYYNGILELLQAFSMLGKEYQLHIYGYGPMEAEVKEAAKKHSNIHFHGRFAPEDTAHILSQYQLLINPRHIDPGIENFTFPSKLVDYILTGKSVLSSNFKTLPPQYRDFVYILEDMRPEMIADCVRNVFAEELEIRHVRGQAGIRYIQNNQTYDKIAEKIISFSEN